MAVVSGPVDPRAVRASVAAASRTEGDPVISVSPTPEPVLRPRRPLAGTAILGGVPAPTPEPVGTVASTPGTGGWYVDGEPTRIALERIDETHAVLVEGEPAAVPAALPNRSVGTNDQVATKDPPGAGRPDAMTASPTARLPVGPGGPARVRVLFTGPGRRTTTGSIVREVVVDGWRIEVEIEAERRATLRERARRGHEAAGRTGPVEVHAIIPGRIVALSVRAGDAVTAGQQLLVLEAMKMQNELRAPREGTRRADRRQRSATMSRSATCSW